MTMFAFLAIIMSAHYKSISLYANILVILERIDHVTAIISLLVNQHPVLKNDVINT